MALMKITPEMMMSSSKEINSKIEEWKAAVDKIYQLNEEMDAMWDGMANDAFNATFNSDRPKYNSLIQMMTEYSNAIQQAATRYAQGEEEVKGIVGRGRK